MKIKNLNIVIKKVAILVIELFLAPLRMTQDIYYHIFTKRSRKKTITVNNLFKFDTLKKFNPKDHQTIIKTTLLAIFFGLGEKYFASDSSLHSYQALEDSGILLGCGLGVVYLLNKLFNKSSDSNCEHLQVNSGDDVTNGEVYRRCKSCKQYLQVNNIASLANKNLAVFIYTSVDRDTNGAFKILRANNTKTYNQDSISKTHEVLLCRINNYHDLTKVVDSLKNWKSSIKFISIGAHGSEDGFSLGHLEVDNTNSNDVFNKINSILDENGTLILESCKTGKKNGVAQNASRVLKDRLVIAPNISDQSFFASPKNAYSRKFLNNCSFSLSLTISLIAYSNFLLNGYYSKKFLQNLIGSTFLTPVIFLFLEFIEINGTGASGKLLQKLFERFPELASTSCSHMRYKNGRLVQR